MAADNDAKPRGPSWRPELLSVPGVDGDPWRALILQQLCYWTTRAKDPEGWVYKTAAELLEEIGGEGHITEKTVARKLRELEEWGAIESAPSARAFDRTKRYKPDRSQDVIDWAVEQAHGPSHIALSDRQLGDAPSKTRRRAMEDAETRHRRRASEPSLGTETTTESTTEKKKPPLSGWDGFGEFLETSFSTFKDKTAKAIVLPPGPAGALCMTMAGWFDDPDEARQYVTTTLANLGTHEQRSAGYFVRCLQKQEWIRKFKDDEAGPMEQTKRQHPTNHDDLRRNWGA